MIHSKRGTEWVNVLVVVILAMLVLWVSIGGGIKKIGAQTNNAVNVGTSTCTLAQGECRAACDAGYVDLSAANSACAKADSAKPVCCRKLNTGTGSVTPNANTATVSGAPNEAACTAAGGRCANNCIPNTEQFGNQLTCGNNVQCCLAVKAPTAPIPCEQPLDVYHCAPQECSKYQIFTKDTTGDFYPQETNKEYNPTANCPAGSSCRLASVPKSEAFCANQNSFCCKVVKV